MKTPRGLHLTYRARLGVVLHNQVKIKGLDIDIRTDRGLRLIPNSRTEHGVYAWLGELRPVAELPVAKIRWTRERTKKRLQSIVVESSPDVMVQRARAYLACVEGAISGDIHAAETLRIASTATIVGDMYSPRVAVARGAQLRGNITMRPALLPPSDLDDGSVDILLSGGRQA